MHEQTGSKVPKWPFMAGDVVFLAAAYLIFARANLPLDFWSMVFLVVCVAGGAIFGILPFVLEYRLQLRLAEIQQLTTVAGQFKNLENVAGQISAATARWNNVHEEAEKVAANARGIAERMGAEVQSFTQFMEKVNDGEKATLRLEADKLRRAEADWLQVLVRMLDHVYALNMGALRSGQPKLIEQLANFQNACREAARRVGLVPFIAGPAEAFDKQRHQLMDGDVPADTGATVAETVATGYTFQGRLLRPALVRLQQAPLPDGDAQRPAKAEPVEDTAQSRLAFEEAGS